MKKLSVNIVTTSSGGGQKLDIIITDNEFKKQLFEINIKCDVETIFATLLLDKMESAIWLEITKFNNQQH